MEAQPGDFFIYRGNERVDVFQLLRELADGKIGQEAWKEKCQELGIAGALLCPGAAEKAIET